MKRLVLLLAGLCSPGVAAADAISPWKVESSTDAITDARETVASVSDGLTGARLSYICFVDAKGASKSFLLTSRQFFGSGAREFVARFDEEPPQKLEWFYSDNAATNYRPADLEPFARSFAGRRLLRVRALTYRGYSVDASFNIAGAEAALARVDANCRK